MKKTKFVLCAIALFISMLALAQEKVDRMPKAYGFLQMPYTANFDQDFKLESNTIAIQRVCFGFYGNLTEDLTYRVSGDFNRRPILVDAFLDYKICDVLSIRAGQFKMPFTIESNESPLDLEIHDYGVVIKKLVGYENGVTGIGALGRDIGVMVNGTFLKGFIEYRIGVFNGNGICNRDNNNRKNVVGRINIHPWIKTLTLTCSYQNGDYKKVEENDVTNTTTTIYGVNNRWSGGVQYKDERFVFRSEYIGGETGRNMMVSDTVFENKPFNSNGFYAVAGYWFNLGKEGKHKLMPAFRYERFERDESEAKGAISYYTAGLFYQPIRQLNLKLNYQFVDYESGKQQHVVIAIMNFRF